MRFEIRYPNGEKHEVELQGTVAILGRDPSCDLVINDVKCSRRHAVMEAGPDGLAVRDSGSANGVFVNGRKTDRSPLKEGDEVKLGDVFLRVLPEEVIGTVVMAPDEYGGMSTAPPDHARCPRSTRTGRSRRASGMVPPPAPPLPYAAPPPPPPIAAAPTAPWRRRPAGHAAAAAGARRPAAARGSSAAAGSPAAVPARAVRGCAPAADGRGTAAAVTAPSSPRRPRRPQRRVRGRPAADGDDPGGVVGRQHPAVPARRPPRVFVGGRRHHALPAAALYLVLTGISGVMGWGLWTLKPWARMAQIVVAGIGILDRAHSRSLPSGRSST